MALKSIPDFSYKGGVPTELVAAYQNKAAQEEQMRMNQEKLKQDKINQVTQIFQAGAGLVGQLQAYNQKQQILLAQQSVSSLLTSGTEQVPSDTMKPAQSSLFPSLNQVPTTQNFNQTPEYKAQLLSALTKMNPEEASKQLLKQSLASTAPNDKVISPQSALIGGSPGKVFFKPGDQRPWDLNTQQPVPSGTKVEPFTSNTDTPLTDEDRKRLAPLAQAVVEGRGTPTAFVNPRSPDRMKISLLASEIDPNFDLSKAPQRVALRKDFSTGTTGKNLTSLNTVIGHLDTLQTKIDKLKPQDLTRYNSVVNYVKNNVGKPEVKEFQAARTAVTQELGKVFQGTGVVTEGEKKQFQDDIDSASSPAQLTAVVGTYMDLIKSRTDAIKYNWSESMGNAQPPIPIINAKTKKVLVKHGYNPDTLEKLENAGGNDLGGGFSYTVR